MFRVCPLPGPALGSGDAVNRSWPVPDPGPGHLPLRNRRRPRCAGCGARRLRWRFAGWPRPATRWLRIASPLSRSTRRASTRTPGGSPCAPSAPARTPGTGHADSAPKTATPIEAVDNPPTMTTTLTFAENERDRSRPGPGDGPGRGRRDHLLRRRPARAWTTASSPSTRVVRRS